MLLFFTAPETGVPSCQGTRGLCRGWGTWLTLSTSQAQPVVKLTVHPRDTHVDTLQSCKHIPQILWIPAQLLCLPAAPDWIQGLLLTSGSSMEIAVIDTCRPHAHSVLGRYGRLPLSSWHQACGLWLQPHSSHQHGAHHSPHSPWPLHSCFLGRTLFLPRGCVWVPHLLQLVSLRPHWLQLLTPPAQGTCTPIWLQCLAPNAFTPPPAASTSSLKHSYAHRTASEVVQGKLPQDLRRRWARLGWWGAGLGQSSLLTGHGLHTTAPSYKQPCLPLTPFLLSIPYKLPCKFCKVPLAPHPSPPKNIWDMQLCIFISGKACNFLMVHQLVWPKRIVCFPCLHYLCSTDLFLCMISSLLSLLVNPPFIEKTLDEVTLLEQRLSSAMCPCRSNTAETAEMYETSSAEMKRDHLCKCCWDLKIKGHSKANGWKM